MIRRYTPQDKEKVIELCREFWGASCVDDLGEFDEDHTSKNLDALIGMGCCLVTDKVDGFILLVESTNLCNPYPVAAEVAWYVTPSARGGAGIKLLEEAFKYCESKGVKVLSMMYMQSSMPESIKKIYGRMGLTLRETTYVKRFY